jgi:hypothetical protein
LQPFTGTFVDAENLEAGEIGFRGEEVVAMDEDGGGLAFQEKFGFQSLGAGIELEIEEITVEVFKTHVPGETDSFGEKPVFHDGRLGNRWIICITGVSFQSFGGRIKREMGRGVIGRDLKDRRDERLVFGEEVFQKTEIGGSRQYTPATTALRRGRPAT